MYREQAPFGPETEHECGEIDRELHEWNYLAQEVAGLYVVYRVAQKWTKNTDAGSDERYRSKNREREIYEELEKSSLAWLRAFAKAGEEG